MLCTAIIYIPQGYDMRILQCEFKDAHNFFSDPVRPNLLKSKMCSFFLDGLGAYIDPITLRKGNPYSEGWVVVLKQRYRGYRSVCCGYVRRSKNILNRLTYFTLFGNLRLTYFGGVHGSWYLQSLMWSIPGYLVEQDCTIIIDSDGLLSCR